MVTIEEAKQSLAQTRQAIEQSRIANLTAFEVRQQTATTLAQRQVAEQQLASAKQRELQKLVPIEAEIKKVEAQIQQQEGLQSQLEDTLRRRLQGKPADPTVPRSVVQKFEQIIEANPALRKALEGGLPTGLTVARKKSFIDRLKFDILGDPRGLFPTITIPKKIEQFPGLVTVAPRQTTFTSPAAVGRNFNKARGGRAGTFTIAIPTGERDGKLVVNDFIFRFDNQGNILQQTKTGQVVISKELFSRRDAIRRKNFPEFDIELFKEVGGPEFKLEGLRDERIIPLKETVRDFKPPKLVGTAGEFLEDVEIRLFPALIGKKFLDSQLGAKLTGGQLLEQDLETARKVQDLLPQTAGFGPEAAKSSVELLNLIRKTDLDIKRDLRKADEVGKTFDRFGTKFDTINADLESGKISKESASRLQNELLNKFNAKGFVVNQKNGAVEITHPVYDRLGGFTGSAWANILKAARKGDSPLKDQALIGTLDFLNSAYQTEKIVLAFRLAGAAGLKLPTATGSAKSLKVLNTISNLSGKALIGSFGVLAGVQQFAATGEPLLGFTSGAGTIAGFLGGSSLKRGNDLLVKLNKRLEAAPPLGKAGKKAISKAKQVQVKKEVVKKSKKKLQITSKQAQEAFVKAPRSRQIQIVERALRGRSISKTELNLARNFMKRSGLKDFQIQDRLAEVLRRIQLSYIRESVRVGVLTKAEGAKQIQLLRQSKAQILKVLKQRTVTSQKTILTPVQVTQQKAIQARIQRAQQALQRGFNTPLQEGILRNQIISLKNSLQVLAKKEVITIGLPSRSVTLQRQIALTNARQVELTTQIKQAITESRKAFLQRQFQTLKTQQVQLQTQLSNQLLLQQQRQDQQSLQNTAQQLSQLVNQQQQSRQLQESLTRQLSLTRSETQQKRLQQRLTIQRSITRQTTRQAQSLRRKLVTIQKRITRGRRVRRPLRPGVPLFPGKPKKKRKKVKKVGVIRGKRFEVFVRKRGKDILFKRFKTKRKARKGLKGTLERTLRASGFILDKGKNRKLRPKITKGFRISKIDPFRIVEKRNLRLDTRKEVTSIQIAKRRAKPFKRDGSKMSKKLKGKKL